MQIAENTVVSFHYTLTNDAGEVLDHRDRSAEGRDDGEAAGHQCRHMHAGLANADDGSARDRACGVEPVRPSWSVRGSCVGAGAVVEAINGKLYMTECGDCVELGDGMIQCKEDDK